MIRHLRTGSREVVWTCLVLLASTPSLAAEVSDTLPIAGRYSQNGKAIKPRDMEAMLESIDSCAPMVHRARGCRIAGKAIGATITLGSLAISAVQMRAMIDAISGQSPSPTPLRNGHCLSPSAPRSAPSCKPVLSIDPTTSRTRRYSPTTAGCARGACWTLCPRFALRRSGAEPACTHSRDWYSRHPRSAMS